MGARREAAASSVALWQYGERASHTCKHALRVSSDGWSGDLLMLGACNVVAPMARGIHDKRVCKSALCEQGHDCGEHARPRQQRRVRASAATARKG